MEKFPEYKIVARAIAEDAEGNACALEEGGKLTWPGRFDNEAYRELERANGKYMFACLYLNHPTSAINQTFQRNWIHYYENKPKECFACTSVDLASAEKTETSDPDYNVVLTSAIEPKSGRIYIIDYTRRRMDPSEVIDVIFAHYRKHKFMKVIVESIGYQRTLVHWLKRRQLKTDTMFYAEELRSLKGSKADRILGLQPYFEAGLVAMRKWMHELEHELLAWAPTMKSGHDDIIDALSMHRKFWVDMTDMAKAAKEPEPLDPMGGESIIKELTGRFAMASSYPFDGGNMDDRYLADHIVHDSLRDRIRERMESKRADALIAL
jgi:predicted phage terminase large subunit-like protein